MTASVLIASNEIYPVDRGGIARLMYNFAVSNRLNANSVDFHFLLGQRLRASAAEIEAAFAGLATVHYCPDSLASIRLAIVSSDPSHARDSLDQLIIESLAWYAGILEAERTAGKSFDVVEFPDFGGWGAAAIAAKRAYVAFPNTTMAVRLHSTFSMIADHEPFMHEASPWMAARFDLERQCLRDADVIIAHLPSTARSTAERFSFPDEWSAKVRVEMPPILLSDVERSTLKETVRDRDARPRDFLFTSRLQPFKRPDLFIRAAVKYLDDGPDRESLFRIASYGWDPTYIDWLKRLVPPRWQNHVIFLDQCSEQERVRLMLESILVIPSDYESLCLLAFEARELDIPLVLNRRCRAFGDEPGIWHEGDDCLFFEGDFVSLAVAMKRSLDWKPDKAAAVPLPDRFYWEDHSCPVLSCPDTTIDGTAVRLGYILYGSVDPYELASYLRELTELRLDRLHVLVSREALEAAKISGHGLAETEIVFHETGWLEPTATEIQSVISQMDCDAVAMLPMDMRPSPILWESAARALAAEPEAAAFTSHAIVEHEDAVRRFVLNFGDAPTIALISDRIAHRASVFRRDALLETGLREVAGDRWHEDLCIRLIRAGHRILVTPAPLASQTAVMRTSRIRSSCFYATQQDEAANQLGAPFRLAGLAHPLDSVVEISHAAWLEQQDQAKAALADRAKLAPPLFRVEEAVLKNSSLEPGADYKELEIVLHGVAIGGVWIPWFAFKFSEFRNEVQLEFRETGNARHLFQSWPPETTDQWGPVAVWSARWLVHERGAFFEDLPDSDLRKLRLLVANLPSVLERLPLNSEERKHWDGKVPDLLRPLAGERRANRQTRLVVKHTASGVRRFRAFARASAKRLKSRVAVWLPIR